MAGRLEEKIAIITGGASGIGEGTVRRFVEEGAKCVIADIQGNLANSLADEIGNNAVPFALDVADENQVSECVDFAVERYGRLDVMFNNAGKAYKVQGKTDNIDDYAYNGKKGEYAEPDFF